MDSIIAAASVIAAGLAIGLAAITQLVKLLKVLLVNLKQKTKFVVHYY
jgi:hypothetical protein